MSDESAYDGVPRQSGPRTALVTGNYRGFSAAGFREGVVVEVFHKNSKKNRSRKFTEYTIRDVRTGTLHYGARRSEATGGKEDGEENILRASSETLNGETFSKQKRAQNVDGDHVVYVLVEGSRLRPVIIGVLPHVANEYGAEEKQGRRTFKIHRGTSFEVKDDGTFEFTRRVDKNKKTTVTIKDDGSTTVDQAGGSKIVLDTDGNIKIDAKSGKDIVLNGGTAKVSRVGDKTQGHTHVAVHSLSVTVGVAVIPVVGTVTIQNATDTMAEGAEHVKA